jgi:hypothetical protein
MGALLFTIEPVVSPRIAAFWIVKGNAGLLQRVSRMSHRRK